MRPSGSLLRPALLLIALLAPAACRPVQPAAPVRVTEARNAAVTSEWRGQTLLIEIASATGIGAATLAFGEGTLPRDIVVRLHLAGLEQIAFAYSDVVVQGSVSSVGEPVVRPLPWRKQAPTG